MWSIRARAAALATASSTRGVKPGCPAGTSPGGDTTAVVMGIAAAPVMIEDDSQVVCAAPLPAGRFSWSRRSTTRRALGGVALHAQPFEVRGARVLRALALGGCQVVRIESQFLGVPRQSGWRVRLRFRQPRVAVNGVGPADVAADRTELGQPGPGGRRVVRQFTIPAGAAVRPPAGPRIDRLHVTLYRGQADTGD